MASPARAQQLTMFVSDYDKLSDARDIAAYRALGAISADICFCRRGSSKDALSVLTSALAGYDGADIKLQNLKNFHLAPKGENYAVRTSN